MQDDLSRLLENLSPDAQQDLLKDVAKLLRQQRVARQKPDITITDFKRQFWKGYQHTAFQAAIDDVLMQVTDYILSDGQRGISRAAIFMPPRHGKTETISRKYPAYMLARKPDLRIITASYSASLAHRNSRFVRNLVTSQAYQAAFGIQLSGRRVDQWDVAQHGGGMIAAGVGGSITGHGAGLILLDDLVKGRAEAESPTIRQRLQDWYTDDLLTRLEAGGAIVLMMTRWHTDDIAGFLLNDEAAEDWHVLSLPALAEEEDLLGREPGEALWAEKYPREWLEKRRDQMGSYSFEALYQQHPIAKAAGLFDAGRVEIVDIPPTCKSVVRFYDLAVSAKSTADYTAGGKLGITDDGKLVLFDMYRRQANPVDTFEAIIRNALLDSKEVPIRLEADNHARAQLDFLLRDERLHGFTIDAKTPEGDKYVRAAPVAARVNAGQLMIVRAPWNKAFLDEIAVFPAGRNDDMVDVLSGGYDMLNNTNRYEYRIGKARYAHTGSDGRKVYEDHIFRKEYPRS